MTERTQIVLEDVPRKNQDLTLEEQEAVKGGAVSLPRGTRPVGGMLKSDPCMGGETSRPR